MKRKVNNEPMYEVKVGHDINTEVTIASAIVDACTLLNTIDTIAYYANKALAEFGVPTYPSDRYTYFVENGAVKLIQRAL